MVKILHRWKWKNHKFSTEIRMVAYFSPHLNHSDASRQKVKNSVKKTAADRHKRLRRAVIIWSGGVPALVELLRLEAVADTDHHQLRRLHAVIAAVLCNISQHDDIRQAMAASGASTVLVQLLNADNAACADDVDVASRAAVVIADVADAGDDQRRAIAQSGGVDALVRLLDSNLEDVLANAINALRVLCTGDVSDIRTSVGAAVGAISTLVEFLSVPSGQYGYTLRSTDS